jgi:septal ring factor EnvC (AmiA/AmiB activator)
MKTYFVISIIILSIITSLGIFGYLSKSYTSDSAGIYDSETQITTTKNLIDIERKRLDNLLDRQSKRETSNKKLDAEIQNSQNRISTLTKDFGEIQKNKNKQNADIGPIRYISELVYQKNDMETIDRAVRLIIMALMFVFDPLAILLVIAANMLLHQRKHKIRPKYSKHSIEIDKSSVFNIENKDFG